MASINGLASATGYSRDAITKRVNRFGLPSDFDPKKVLALIPLDEVQANKISLEEARTDLAIEDTRLKRLSADEKEGRLADVFQLIEAENELLEGIAAIIKSSSLAADRKEDVLSAIRDHGKTWRDKYGT